MAAQKRHEPRKYETRTLHPTGKLLKQLRKQSGYTQEQMREHLGFQAASAISKLESRDFVPDLPRLRKLIQLLKPDPQQQTLILAYFGFQANDLANVPDPLWKALEQQDQPPELKALDQLFYLFTYQRDYEQVIQVSQTWQHRSYTFPTELSAWETELQLILRELFACRGLLAKAQYQQQFTDAREAELRATNTLQLLATTPPHPFRESLHIHSLTLLYTAIYQQLHSAANHQTLQPSQLTATLARLQTELLPQLNRLLAQTPPSRPLLHLQLFTQRDSLQILSWQADHHDEQQLLQWLCLPPDTKAKTRTEHLRKRLQTAPQAWPELYSLWLNANSPSQQLRQQALASYTQTLQAHQLMRGWDGEAPEVLRPLLHTFLSYPILLAHLQRFSEAQLALDLLYLRLNVMDTYYHWYSNQALMAALEALHQLGHTQNLLSTLPLIHKMANALLEAHALAEQVQALSQSRIQHYMFCEERAFVVLFSLLENHADLPANMQQLLQMAQTYWAEN